MEFELDNTRKRQVSRSVGLSSSSFKRAAVIGVCFIVAAPLSFFVINAAAAGYSSGGSAGELGPLIFSVPVAVILLVFGIVVFPAAGFRAANYGFRGRRNERLVMVGDMLMLEYRDREVPNLQGRCVLQVDVRNAAWHVEPQGRFVVFDSAVRWHYYPFYGTDPIVPFHQMQDATGAQIGLYWKPDLLYVLESHQTQANRTW